MSDLFISACIFIISLAILIKAADFFTDTAEKIGLFIGLPPFIVGVTIVSIGTSIPELISSLIAVSENASEVVVGNVVGSNITNIFLVVGTAAIISAGNINIIYDLVMVDLPLFVGSAFLLSLVVWDQNFSIGESLLLIAGYIIYCFYILKGSQGDHVNITEGNEQEEKEKENHLNQQKGFIFFIQEIGILIACSIFIYLGADYTVDAVIKLSDILDVGKDVIAVSAVALGTSLPELSVTINAALKGNAEVAVGNVLGSNIFNSFVVMGIPGLFGHLDIPDTVIDNGIPTMIAGTILLFFCAQDKKLTSWEGWLFFIIYGWFIGQTFEVL